MSAFVSWFMQRPVKPKTVDPTERLRCTPYGHLVQLPISGDVITARKICGIQVLGHEVKVKTDDEDHIIIAASHAEAEKIRNFLAHDLDLILNGRGGY